MPFQGNKPVLSIYYPESMLMGIMGGIDITKAPVLKSLSFRDLFL